jgi:hypothetical protein
MVEIILDEGDSESLERIKNIIHRDPAVQGIETITPYKYGN